MDLPESIITGGLGAIAVLFGGWAAVNSARIKELVARNTKLEAANEAATAARIATAEAWTTRAVEIQERTAEQARNLGAVAEVLNRRESGEIEAAVSRALAPLIADVQEIRRRGGRG